MTDNAFKFSSKGSRVEIKGFYQEKEYILIVSDRGGGISDEQIATIGAFHQYERKRYEQQGSGLGLAISMILLKMCVGSLSLSSEYGQGAVVLIRIPV